MIPAKGGYATSLLDDWANWCVRYRLDFAQYTRGAELLLTDREYFEREGFRSLMNATDSTVSA